MVDLENRDSSAPVELSGFLSEFRDAIKDEIVAVKKSGQTSITLYSGNRVESRGFGFCYRFRVEFIYSIPADTPCKLFIGSESFSVTVISVEETNILISSLARLPDNIGVARLESGTTVLLERLISCIEDNHNKENLLSEQLLHSDGMPCAFHELFSYDDLAIDSDITKNQSRAIAAALTNDITYIWGPPGTGKTTVIARIINELFNRNRSVLMISHTNVAVDGAVEKAYALYLEKHPNADEICPILRIGVPAKKLPNEVLLSTHVSMLGKESFAQKEDLEAKLSSIQHQLEFICPILAKSNWIKDNKLPLLKEALLSVSATKAQAVSISEEINRLNVSIESEKATYPDYNKSVGLIDERNAVRVKFDSACSELASTQKSIRDLPDKIRQASDEIENFKKYAELKKEASEFEAEEQLKDKRDCLSASIASLTSEILDLSAKQDEANDIILQYNGKSSFGKFLAGKRTLLRSQAIVQETTSRLTAANAELKFQRESESRCVSQIEKLSVIKEKMKKVFPSYTVPYWVSIVTERKSELNNAQERLSDNIAQKDKLAAELDRLEFRINQSKSHCDNIEKLIRSVLNNQDKLEQVKRDVIASNNQFLILLKDEISLYADLIDGSFTATNEMAYEELSKRAMEIQKELAPIDINVLVDEKAHIESEKAELSAKLDEVNAKIQELEKQAILNARVVGATLVKSYLSNTLRSRTFDTIILDEASMASVPALWCAACLAQSSVVIVGDFLQLSPIIISKEQLALKWLGKDIFYHSGMLERAKSKDTCPANFIMLNDQFRMESDIADIANMYYGAYGGLLSNDAAKYRIRDRNLFYEWYSGKRTKQSIHLIDTESLHAWVTGVAHGKSSRLNCLSAMVDVDLAFKFLDNKLKALDPSSAKPVNEPSVLIIAPYRPHVLLLNKLIESEYKRRGFRENPNLIRAGTIHTFQGSEADIVIFDLVIDEPHWKANLFVNREEDNATLRQMFNVAVTRARFKLFVVGNFAYCQNRARHNALGELLDKLLRIDRLPKVDVKSILPDIAFSRVSDIFIDNRSVGNVSLHNEGDFFGCLLHDIGLFKSRMIIYSPFMSENRIGMFLPALVDTISSGKKIIVVTKAISDRKRNEFSMYQSCEKELREIGVTVIHKNNMHEKLVLIDRDIVWSGSLNVLSFTGSTGEFMERKQDNILFAYYEQFLDIEHICEAVEKTYEQSCPCCNSEMTLREGDRGGIYWGCVACDYTRDADQQYPIDGVLYCKCGAPYEFSMKNVPRWVCSKNPRHYQRMRKSDLCLEKMAALIPREYRDAVNVYFHESDASVHAPNPGFEYINEPDGNPRQLSLFDEPLL